MKRTILFLSCVLLLSLILGACGESTEKLPESSALSSAEMDLPADAPVSSSIAEASSAPSHSPEPDEASSQEPETSEVEQAPLVRCNSSIPLYAQPGGEIVSWLEAGQDIPITKTSDPLWYTAAFPEDSLSGYVYGEELHRVLEDGSISEKSLFAEYAEENLAGLRQRFPEGKYWNHMGHEDISWGDETPGIVTDIPCDHSLYGELYCNFYNGKTEALFPYGTLCECLGFASLLSDQIFGSDAPLFMFQDPDLLRVGDHIRLREWEHSMTVSAVTEEGLVVAEVNQDYEDCLISWSRVLSWEELDGLLWDCEFISRYPLCPDGNGGFAAWPEDAAP